MEITAKTQSNLNTISKIVDIMYEYQMENNITKHCAYNCFVLFSILKHHCPELQPKVVQIWAINAKGNNTFGITSRHLVIGFDYPPNKDDYIDPSYEFKNADLYGSFKHFKSVFGNEFLTGNAKELIEGAIEFQQYAKKMTEGKGLWRDTYCVELLDYIKKKLPNCELLV